MFFPLLVLCRISPFTGNLFALPRRTFKSVNSKYDSYRHAKCVFLTGYGGYDKLTIAMKDVPPPGPGQVLVGVKAGGMNFSDMYVRQGLFRGAGLPKPPFVMGKEAAGQIEQVGDGVELLKVGDRVACLSNKTGLWSEFACVDASECILIPDNMDFEDAAAFYINYLTAYCAIFPLGNLKPGNRIFIHSLAGGVGWAATQLAKTVPGVTVLGTAAPWKYDVIRDNGVDFPLPSSKTDYVEKVLEKFPEGVDLVLDNQSGAEFHYQRKMLQQMGIIIHLGANSLLKGEHKSILPLIKMWWGLKNVSVNDLRASNHGVGGFNLDTFMEKSPRDFSEVVKEINSLYAKGLVKPRIDSIWTFNEVSKATQHLTFRKNIGKIILKAH